MIRFTGGPRLYMSLALFLGIVVMALSESRDFRVIAIAPIAALYTLTMGFNAMEATAFARVAKKEN